MHYRITHHVASLLFKEKVNKRKKKEILYVIKKMINYIEGVLPRIQKSGQFTHLAVHSIDKARMDRHSKTMIVLFPEKKYLA